jgi:phage tail tube protein FII
MNIFRKIDEHSDLVNRMADKLDVDLGTEMLDHYISAEGYRTAVMRCTRCDSVDQCKGFLAEGGHADHAPEYCRNKGLLNALVTG